MNLINGILNNANIYKKQLTKRLSKKNFKKFSHIENESLYQLVIKEYMDYGYYKAKEKINELYSQDKISLLQKGKIMDNISSFQMMTSKEKKFFKKLEKKS